MTTDGTKLDNSLQLAFPENPPEKVDLRSMFVASETRQKYIAITNFGPLQGPSFYRDQAFGREPKIELKCIQILHEMSTRNLHPGAAMAKCTHHRPKC